MCVFQEAYEVIWLDFAFFSSCILLMHTSPLFWFTLIILSLYNPFMPVVPKYALTIFIIILWNQAYFEKNIWRRIAVQQPGYKSPAYILWISD